MSEKIVSVDIRMVVTPTGYTSCSIGSTYIPPGDWTPAMHAAAEELRAQGAELGENQWRCESGLVCTFSDATEDGITLSWSDDVAPKHHKLADVTRHGLKEAAERWHAKNRPEAHSGSPSGERLPIDKPWSEYPLGTKAHAFMGGHWERVANGWKWCTGSTFPTPGGDVTSVELPSPLNGTGRKTEESDATQTDLAGEVGGASKGTAVPSATATNSTGAEVETDAPAQVVLTRPIGIPASATIWAEVVDGLGRKVGAWFECDDLSGEQIVRMVAVAPRNGAWMWSRRWDYQWDGNCYPELTPSAAAQCRQLYERGMAEMAKVDAFMERVERAAKGDPVRIAEAIVAARARPPCIPSHIPDTDWTVIEGRAVWRDGLGCVRLEDRTVATFGGWLFFQHNTYESLRGMQRDVPKSLFIAARRWMGWEKEETAQAFDARGLGNLFDEGAEPESLKVIMLRVELDIANDSASRWEQVARDLAERIKSGGAP